MEKIMFVNLNTIKGNILSITEHPRTIKRIKELKKSDPIWFNKACYILSHIKKD